MRYKIAKFCAYTPFVLYALEFVIKSFEFGIFVWLALIACSIGGMLFCALAQCFLTFMSTAKERNE